MINRVYIKELLGFKSVEFEFQKGLVVITGPSGAGKSVLMNALLANFGLVNQEAKLCEVSIAKPKGLESEEFELEDEIVVKSIKKDRVRFFLNGQNISRKALKGFFKNYLSYISVRDKSGFENSTLLELIDNFITKNSNEFKTLLRSYSNKFALYIKKKGELFAIEKRIRESKERSDFLKFEIAKLESLKLTDEDEYGELLKVKKQLSKIDRINEVVQKVETIFEYEDSINELFLLLDKESSYFSDAMNQLRGDFEDIETLSSELLDTDIESVLDRLEELSGVIKRFGSIDAALGYLQEKREELASFETIQEDLTHLQSEIKRVEVELTKEAKTIDNARMKAAKEIEIELFGYLKELKLPKVSFHFNSVGLYEYGSSIVELSMQKSKIEQLSGGEFNRVRLALLSVAASGSESSGVIVLDEIDANVSGDESIAIANMISKLSQSFQVFAISHQPHLTSKANQHILVTKSSETSVAKLLDAQESIKEIARIVGGENYNKEALDFAKKLQSSSK